MPLSVRKMKRANANAEPIRHAFVRRTRIADRIVNRHSGGRAIGHSKANTLNAETGWRRAIRPTNKDNMNANSKLSEHDQQPQRPGEPLLLTVAEVASLLRTSTKAIYAMAERGQIGGITRIGRRLLFRRDLLVHWLGQKSNAIAEGVER
jgi:excisionase family DNA binding protein